eukprot:2806945-Pyramimonas_sp.AAC.2
MGKGVRLALFCQLGGTTEGARPGKCTTSLPTFSERPPSERVKRMYQEAGGINNNPPVEGSNIAAWRARGKLPLAVDMTAAFVEAKGLDPQLMPATGTTTATKNARVHSTHVPSVPCYLSRPPILFAAHLVPPISTQLLAVRPSKRPLSPQPRLLLCSDHCRGRAGGARGGAAEHLRAGSAAAGQRRGGP